MPRPKRKKLLIIDGYNIINSWGELSDIAEEDLESSREKLIDYMIEYSKYMNLNAILVFDAYNVKSAADRETKRADSLKVVYTKENQTADSYIEKYISNIHDRRNLEISVATSDQAEQQIVLGKGGSRITARELELDVLKAKEDIRKHKSLETGKKTIQRSTIAERVKDDKVISRLEEIRRRK